MLLWKNINALLKKAEGTHKAHQLKPKSIIKSTKITQGF